jgi:biotin--protein ligase
LWVQGKVDLDAGVGLNVANQHPTICLDTLLHELCSDPTTLTRHELLAAILGRFEVLFNVFLSQGFSALESKYYQRWLHSGQTVELEEREEGSSKVSKVYVRIQGLTTTGYLRAVDDSDESYELHPDGNSFDFLHGLVRKKM